MNPEHHLLSPSPLHPFPPLPGERVLLRLFTPADAADVMGYGADREVIRYLDWGPTDSLADANQFLEGVLNQYAEGTGLVVAIVERESARVVGNIALMSIDPKRRRAELGYVLDRRCWGRGYMTEAGLLLLRYAFVDRELDEVVAYVDPVNHRSRRLLERLGMQRDPGLHWYSIRGEPKLHERHVSRRQEFLCGGDSAG
jgi:ribosomal-protein-alanine N-acetyltransferase